MSILPNSVTVRSTNSSTARGSATSETNARQRPPASRISSATLSISRHPAALSSSGYRSGGRPVPVTTIAAPACASSLAIGRPMLRIRPAPVTIATLPASSCSIGNSCSFGNLCLGTFKSDAPTRVPTLTNRQAIGQAPPPRDPSWRPPCATVGSPKILAKGSAMDFKFSEEDEAFRRDFRQWLEKNLPRDWHDEGELHDPDTKEEFERRRGWHRELYDQGWMCIHWPREYGGRGASLLQQIIYSQELDRAKAPPTVNFQGIARVGPTLMQWGSAEQKKRYIPRIPSAEEIWCQGLSA